MQVHHEEVEVEVEGNGVVLIFNEHGGKLHVKLFSDNWPFTSVILFYKIMLILPHALPVGVSST